MKQFGARVWVILTAILVIVVIAWIIGLILSKTSVLKQKISFSWKEKIKTKQIKKELKEKKETIINPNTEDTSIDEEFQEVIETAVAEKNEEDKKEESESEEKKQIKKEQKSEEKEEDKSESSVFE